MRTAAGNPWYGDSTSTTMTTQHPYKPDGPVVVEQPVAAVVVVVVVVLYCHARIRFRFIHSPHPHPPFLEKTEGGEFGYLENKPWHDVWSSF